MFYVLEMQISNQAFVHILKGGTESFQNSKDAYVGKSWMLFIQVCHANVSLREIVLNGASVRY